LPIALICFIEKKMNANSIVPSEWALFYKLLGNLLAAGYSPVESLSQLMQEPLFKRLQTQLRPFLDTPSSATSLIGRLQRPIGGMRTSKLPPTASLADCLRLKMFALDAAIIHMFENTTRVEDHIELLQALSARYSQENWMNQLRGGFLPLLLVYLAVSSGIVGLLLYKVLPLFAALYEDMGGTLPELTSFLLAFGHWLLLLLLLLAMALLVLYFRPSPLTLTDSLRLTRPWGILSEKTALARFTHMLALLLSKNIAPRNALIVATTATGNTVIEHRLQNAFSTAVPSHTFDTSSPVTDILKSCPLVPSAFIAALGIAERTQKLKETLPELTEMSADQLCRYTKVLNNSINAVLFVFISILIGWVVLATYQPIFNLGVLM
jgi:type II secretory pathway component PulF